MRLTVKHYIFSVQLFLFFISAFSSGITPPSAQSNVRFTENKNQWNKKILFRADLDGGSMFLEKNCFTYNFYDKETLRKNHVKTSSQRNDAVRCHAFRMTFLNSLDYSGIISKEETPDHCNYFIGSNKNKWATDVKNYKEVIYKSIYSGIDMQVLGQDNSLKYNFFVAPHADPNSIQLFYEGLEKISIENKSLKITTSINEIIEEKPFAYQIINGKRVEVRCEFVLRENTVHFRFPRGYNKNFELVIDPILVFACTSGSVADNFGMTATYDSDGNLYAGGTVYGAGYPVTLGAYDPTWNGGAYSGVRTDVVITKYDASGTFLQYSTYLGGTISTEVVSSLIVNSQNELMLFGATGSSDFPVTANAFDTSFNGGSYLLFPANGTEYLNGTDLYLSKFSSTGSALLASTFVGGSGNDGTNNSNTLVYNYGDYYRGEIQVDNAGNFYVASCTVSADFPVTAGCSQAALGGGMDGVIFKMNPDLTSMTWSTFVGGSADDGCYALNIDSAMNVYTTGGTSSADFRTTAGSFSTAYNGGIADGFITKINSSGSAILSSTFVGTASYDQSFLIQFDNDYNVYVVGQSEGSMPVSAGVYSNANSRQFIWKMNSSLNSLMISTIFGNGNGTVNISPSAFLVDVCGNIYVSGWGGNLLTSDQTLNMPLTSNAFQSVTDGFNFYLLVLTPNASSLLYATYFGGSKSREHVDGGTSRFDKKGIVYQAVCANCGGSNAFSQHDDFPVTDGSWPNTGTDVNHNTQNYNCNMGVFKFNFQAAGVDAQAKIIPNDTICTGSTISFTNSSANALSYQWDFGDGSAPVFVYSPKHTYAAPGTYNITLIAYDPAGCIFSDTTNLTAVVIPPPVIGLGNDTVWCTAPNMVLDAGTSGNIYTWSTGETTQKITVTAPGTYWGSVSNGICQVYDTIKIDQYLPPALGPDTTICDGQTLTLDMFSAGASYLWSTGESTSSITAAAANNYWVTVSWNLCQAKDTINVKYTARPVIALPEEVTICPHSSIVLDPGGTADSYIWSTGDTTQTIVASNAGEYVVTASNANCSTKDSTLVNVSPDINWQEKDVLCNVEKYTLDANVKNGTYLWSTGASTQTIDILEPGIYWVTVSVRGCVLNDTITIEGSIGNGVIWFPNTFTPNENGVNDIFTGKGTDITYFDLMIFNRWGELIFETEKQEQGWDGFYKGRLAEQDVYVWKIKYKTFCSNNKIISKIGHVTLVR